MARNRARSSASARRSTRSAATTSRSPGLVREAAQRALDDARADFDRHRRRRARQGARPVRGRDDARAVAGRRARRGRQADPPRAHRGLGRRLDRDRRRRTWSRPAVTSACSTVCYEKQSEGNAQWGSRRRRAAAAWARAASSRRGSAAYIPQSERARAHRLDGRGQGPPATRSRTRTRTCSCPDITIEKVKESPDAVGPDPLPRVVPVVRRCVRDGARPTRPAAKKAPRPPAWVHRATRSAASSASSPGRDTGAARRRASSAREALYKKAGHHQPARADRRAPSSTCRSRWYEPMWLEGHLTSSDQARAGS